MITASGGLTVRPDLAEVDPTGVAPVAAKGDPDAVEGTGIGLEIAALWRDPTGDRGQVLGGDPEGSLGAEAEATHVAEAEVRVPNRNTHQSSSRPPRTPQHSSRAGRQPRSISNRTQARGPGRPRKTEQPNTRSTSRDARLDALEDKLQRILTAMERGTQAQAPPPPRRNIPEAVRNTNPGDEEEQSSNPEFTELLKLTFQYIQTNHHYENWTDIPDRINKSIDTIVQNIRPPMPAAEVQHQLTQAGNEFKSAITAAVQGHLHSCATATREKLSKTNMADFDMAATRAKKTVRPSPRKQSTARYRRQGNR